MANKSELTAQIEEIDVELRELMEKVRDPESEINLDEARASRAELAGRKSRLQKELAELDRPDNKRAGAALTNEALLACARERRVLSIGGAANLGAINQIRTLFREIAETDDILSRASYYYGPNAATNIPVLSPMADPAGYDEGATSVTKDSAAAVTVTEIQPKAYASILPVTAEMLQMGAVDIESEIPDLFARAFRRVMHAGMLTGTGTGKAMKGIFTSAKDNTAGVTKIAGTAVKISELAGLALKIRSKDESFAIIMNPSVYQGILSDATAGEDVKLYKESLIRDKSIEGVNIVLDAAAPSATAAGSVLAVAVPFSRYAIGVAGELVIKPVDVLGDTKSYFQAIMFFSGKQISDSDLYSLAVAAGG